MKYEINQACANFDNCLNKRHHQWQLLCDLLIILSCDCTTSETFKNYFVTLTYTVRIKTNNSPIEINDNVHLDYLVVLNMIDVVIFYHHQSKNDILNCDVAATCPFPGEFGSIRYSRPYTGRLVSRYCTPSSKAS